MAEPDILYDLLTADPNEPATKGTVLLLRTETESEFRALRSEMGQMGQKIDQIQQSLELVARNVALLLKRK